MLLRTIPVYEYDELSNAVKAGLREKEKEFMSEVGDCTRDLNELFEAELTELGYPTNNIMFSLGYCQGDGVAFYGHVDTDDLVKIRKRLLPSARNLPKTLLERVQFSIGGREGRYHHYNSMTPSWEAYEDLTEKQEAAVEGLLEAIQEDVVDVSRRLESEGYRLIEDMDSDEYLDDMLRDAGRLYYGNGEGFDADDAAETDVVLDSLRLAA